MKRLVEAGADVGEDAAGPATKRTLFTELQLAPDHDPGDAIDDEVPGALPADRPGVQPVVLDDQPFVPYQGRELTQSALALDPGFARAQRRLTRTLTQERQQVGSLQQAEERYDQPQETHNEAGDLVEPFHLKREREEGLIDPEGFYIQFGDRKDEDAWLESLDEEVAGTGAGAPTAARKAQEEERPASGRRGRENASNLVAEPPPLGLKEVHQYMRRLAGWLQPGETPTAALRRLAGTGPTVRAKFTSTQAAEKAFHEHMQRGYTVAPGNVPLFEQVTEAAEVLLDAGQGNIYSTTKEQLVQQLKQAHQAELAPAEAAPSRDDAAAVAAVLAGDTAEERAEGAHEELHLGAAYGTELPRRHKPPPPAAPAAAAEPPVRGGSSVPFAAPQPPLLAQRAELGFAKEVQHDAELERREAGPLPPPKEVEEGLGLLGASPTEVELHRRQEG